MRIAVYKSLRHDEVQADGKIQEYLFVCFDHELSSEQGDSTCTVKYIA